MCYIHIYSTWNVSASDGEYPFFREFVEVVSKATVNDLEDLTEYEDDERLEDTDFRQLAIAVHPDTTHTITSFDDDVRIERRMVFTELGLCDVINAPIAVLLQEPYVEHLYILTIWQRATQCNNIYIFMISRIFAVTKMYPKLVNR